MSMPEYLAESGGGWLRRPRRYSPFNRSHGLRRLPDDAIGIAVICSVVLHTVLVFGLVRATQAPRWSQGAEASLVSLADLVASVPDQPRPLAPPPAPSRSIRTSSSRPRSAPPEPRPPVATNGVGESSPPTSIPRRAIAG